jgi:predicted permease
MGQFALAFVLLVSATLFLRSLREGSHVDPGFDVQHLLTADVALNPTSYPPARSEQYFRKAIAEIGRLPGVRSVAGATVVPLGMEHWVVSLKAGDHIVQRVFANSVTSGYFRTMRIPLLQGRDFQDGDRAEGAQVAIVNETLAKRYFKGNALDHLVYMPNPGPKPTFSPVKVIGVVSDSKYGSLGEERMPALYLPFSQQNGMLTLEVRTDSEPANILGAVGQTIASLDPHTPIKIELMQDRLAGALLPSKIASLLLTSIGVLGLLLATIGIYGMVAYSVARRTNEIGIRMALGATKADVLRMILRDATNLVFVGVAVGSMLSVFIVQALRSIVPAGMHVVDPVSFAMVGCVLTIVALIAALIPAWKGSRIDPTIALRYE